MPVRPFSRDITWLLPPTLEELIPADHPARFVAAFIDEVDRTAWAQLGISLDGNWLGAPEYHPRVLLSIWVYGFMSGVRSARKLEAACRDQLPYLWLTGWQIPDHNTLWRFYKDHRKQMRKLLKRTIKTAMRLGLVDLAVQAVDGSKIAANAAKGRTYDKGGLEKLLQRTEGAIAELEAQNSTGGEPSIPRLPAKLAKAKVLRDQVQGALKQVTAEEASEESINLTDGDARQMKGRQGIVPAYNAQAVVSRLKPEVARHTGLFITAADVIDDPDDHASLVPMIEEALEMTESVAEVTLADGGYHSGKNLQKCKDRGQKVLMSESQRKELGKPYHKDNFKYDVEGDTYTCPQGQTLVLSTTAKRKDRPEKKVYRGSAAKCRECDAFGQCTKQVRQGRSLEVGPHEELLQCHRALMATEEAKGLYRQRKQLPEPVFGIMKEQQGARRFLLRGLSEVKAEWTLLASAFNLRTLARVWQQWPAEKRSELIAAARV